MGVDTKSTCAAELLDDSTICSRHEITCNNGLDRGKRTREGQSLDCNNIASCGRVPIA